MPDDQIEKNEMGGAYSRYGEEKRCTEWFGEETSRKENTWRTQKYMRL